MFLRITLVFFTLLPAFANADEPVTEDSFANSWYSVDSGGGVSAGGGFQIVGSIGQFDTSQSSGGSFEVVGGFLVVPTLNGCDDFPSGIFCDDFESGNSSAWTRTIGTPTTPESATSER